MSGSSHSYRHILKYTGIFGSIQVVTMLASILRNKAAALLIDRYGQGLSELFSNTVNLISSATTLVMPVAVVRRVSMLYERYGDGSEQVVEEIKVIRSWSVLTGLAGTVIVMLSASLLSLATFGVTNFSKNYFFLSPMLLLLAINGTEVALLKATRRLRQLTIASVAGSVVTLVVCVVSYYFWRLRGIVISLDVGLLFTTLLNLRYTLKAYPYRATPFRWSVLRKGRPLVGMSIAFLVASVMVALSEMLVRAVISHSGSIENVGLYGAGFALTVTYTRFIFSAMDADYYPRLSGIAHDTHQMNIAINRQVVVCVLLIVPCLIVFTLFLPQIVSLLYNPAYREVIPMVICAAVSMFCKAVCTPVAYVALAKADSLTFLVMETISAVLMGGFVIAGYKLYSLMGCGIGLSLSQFVELVVITLVYNRNYGALLYPSTLVIIALGAALLAGGLLSVVLLPATPVRYVAAILFALIAGIAAWRILAKS